MLKILNLSYSILFNKNEKPLLLNRGSKHYKLFLLNFLICGCLTTAIYQNTLFSIFGFFATLSFRVIIGG